MSECGNCGSAFQTSRGVFWAAYDAPDGQLYCCAACADGLGCSCALVAAPGIPVSVSRATLPTIMETMATRRAKGAVKA